jgi:hypothetical protein
MATRPRGTKEQPQLPDGAGRLGVLSPGILRAIFSIRAVTNRSAKSGYDGSGGGPRPWET